MQAVCQFHQQHADILSHGHEQFANILGVQQVSVREVQLAHLGEAVHDFGDFLPEFRPDLLQCHQRVFHGVVEHPTGHAHGVQAPFRQAQGNRQRMKKVGFAAPPHLGPMALPSHPECLVQ